MNAMPFNIMKFAALLAVVVFSVQPVQRSTCKCQHCPQRSSAGVKPDGLICCDESLASQESDTCRCSHRPAIPCKRCQKAPTNQGIEPQSEQPHIATDMSQSAAWFLSLAELPQAASPLETLFSSGVSLCISLCRFRL